MQLIEGHQASGEVISDTDEHVAKLLDQLEKDKMLEDTVVVMISDHGLHMAGLFELFKAESVFT